MKYEKAEYAPKCPFFDKEIDRLGVHPGEEPVKFFRIITKRSSALLVLSCPECHHIVGAADQAYAPRFT